MGFVQSFDNLMKMVKETYDFYDAEMLVLVWETKQEIVKRLLPPPLSASDRPIVVAFLANYPRTNFSAPYLESALLLKTAYNGINGYYCLAMPVTNDLGMAGGREQFGYPKKMANILFKRSGSTVEGSVERHGIAFFGISAALDGKPDDAEFEQLLAEMTAEQGVTVYNFKHFMAPDGSGFDFNPRLISERVIFRPNTIELGRAEVSLTPSDYDPWFELEIVKMLGAAYTIGNNKMLKGEVVAEVEPMAFAPYAFLKWDAPHLIG